MGYRNGNLVLGQPLPMTVQSVSLVADNTRIDASMTSLLLLTSNNTTATNRTFIINASPIIGHELQVVLITGSSMTCELANSGTCKLTGGWTPLQWESLTLVSDGTYWIEKCRSSTSIAGGTVTLAQLATGITPSHVVKFAGNFTTTAGSATVAQTLTGVASTDIVIASLKTKGGSPQTILTTTPTTNTITYVFSADPSTDHVVAYQVLRAAT